MKKYDWKTDSVLVIDVTDGPEEGHYEVDIGSLDAVPCGGLMRVGSKKMQMGWQPVYTKVDDIPGYWEHYRRTPRALREQRSHLTMNIRILR